MEQRLRLGARTPIKGISYVFKDTSKCRSFWPVISDLPEWSGFFASFRRKEVLQISLALWKHTRLRAKRLLWQILAIKLCGAHTACDRNLFSVIFSDGGSAKFRQIPCFLCLHRICWYELGLNFSNEQSRIFSNLPWYFPLLKQFKTPISKSSVQQPRASWWPHTSLPSPSEFQFRDFRGKLCAWSDTIFITLRRKHLHSHESLVPKIRRATTRISRDQRSSHHGPPFWVSRVF